jgi:hypothetical protein
MPAAATTSATAATPCSSSATPASPLSVRRPALSPRKRKLSDVSEAASPTSLDEVASADCSSSSINASSSLEERVISPKKKARAEGPSDPSKWESHVVASFAASALDLEDAEPETQQAFVDPCEPIAFWAAPAGDLAADELDILRHFLA